MSSGCHGRNRLPDGGASVKKLRDTSFQFWKIEECMALLSPLGDRNVIVKFVRRSTNMVAHFSSKSTGVE